MNDERLTWRALLSEAEARFRQAGLASPAVDARRIAERASGVEPGQLPLHLEETPTVRGVGFFDAMMARREAGEPLQYVLRRWGFRTLDLYLDSRVLIPRPETEVVVEVALQEAARLGRPERPLVAVDLGTGSGAIALSLAVELPAAQVWGVDRSSAALAVARANLAGLGRAAVGVTLREGSWFSGLPAELRGRIDLVVSNPPYVAEGDHLPPEVVDWEPREALVAGPTGLEAVAAILSAAPRWLGRPATVVCEIAPHQGERATALAVGAGATGCHVRPDLTGRPRVLVARW